MDIEAIVKKYERLIPAGAYTLGEGISAALTEQAAEYEAELARLWKEIHLSCMIRSKMGRLLDGVAVVLKGEPPELVRHSWHDLPELCKQRIHQLSEANHASELRAYEATVANLEQRIRQMEGVMVPDDSGLEFALEQLVNVCNNYNDACNWSETISAEAALEKLYKRRLAAAKQPKKEGE